MINVLYIHGMGGGGDSRIPSILNSFFRNGGECGQGDVRVVVRTYDFDPEKAHEQIMGWVEELQPKLIIGESLGSIHAIRISGVPHLLISPALNAPLFLDALSWLTLIPGVSHLFGRIYKPREGDRQPLHFTYRVMRNYASHRKEALANSLAAGSDDSFYAFFGRKDHYRKSGIVSVRSWKKHFGQSFEWYDGTHFTEEEYIYSRVLPCLRNVLNINE